MIQNNLQQLTPLSKGIAVHKFLEELALAQLSTQIMNAFSQLQMQQILNFFVKTIKTVLQEQFGIELHPEFSSHGGIKDLVIVQKGKIVVIDYKSGERYDSYVTKMHDYMDKLNCQFNNIDQDERVRHVFDQIGINYQTKGYLAYIEKDELIQIQHQKNRNEPMQHKSQRFEQQEIDETEQIITKSNYQSDKFNYKTPKSQQFLNQFTPQTLYKTLLKLKDMKTIDIQSLQQIGINGGKQQLDYYKWIIEGGYKSFTTDIEKMDCFIQLIQINKASIVNKLN